jgi:hypothetical protein
VLLRTLIFNERLYQYRDIYNDETRWWRIYSLNGGIVVRKYANVFPARKVLPFSRSVKTYPLLLLVCFKYDVYFCYRQ